MAEPAPSIRLDSESDEYVVVSVVAVAPTWRDCWAIIRGRYKPLVKRTSRMTAKGLARALKKGWASEKVRAQLYQSSPLLDMLRGEPFADVLQQAVVPIHKQKGSTDD